MISGGLHTYVTNNRTYIYDVDGQRWSDGPQMQQRRRAHGCACLTLANGTSIVVVTGGATSHSREFDTEEATVFFFTVETEDANDCHIFRLGQN